MTAGLAAYREPVTGPLRFIREQIVLADGRRLGQALRRADSWIEDDLLRPVFEVGSDGLPRHRLVYLELPRGHWKSGGAGAVALAEAILHASTDVVVAATDEAQAAIVGENISGYLARNPTLRRSVKETRGEFTVPARASRIRVISSDEPSAWGLGGTHRRFRVVADELTAWPAERGERFWGALVSATGKVADAQTIVLSNAGLGAGRSWQWGVREAAEREPWGYLYTAPGIVASWVRPAWVERMRTLLPPAAFERVILNRWTSEQGDFVTAEQWRRCIDHGWAPQTRGQGAYVAGLDLGLVRDRTALAIVHSEHGHVVLDDLQVWGGSRREPVSIATVERAVLDAARRFRTLRLVADPWQLKGSIERLRGVGVRVDEFAFGPGSIGKLSAALFEAITTAALRVYPDPDLEAEILGLQVVQTPSGWRFDHRAGGFSDRAVALAMAVQTARRRKPASADGASAGHPAGASVAESLASFRTAGKRELTGVDPDLSYGMKF